MRHLAGLLALVLVASLGAGAPWPQRDSAAPARAADPAADVTVDREVLQQLAVEGTTTFWVSLRSRADLAPAAGIDDRAERGRLVHQRLVRTARTSQAELLALLDSAAADYEPFWIANTVRVTGTADLLERITALPEVEQVDADHTYQIPEPDPAEAQATVSSVEWNIDRIRANEVWDIHGATGEGIVVGVIDSGALYTHPALVNQYRGNLGNGEFDHNYNWWDPSSVCREPSGGPCDNNGHGTHVTGTILGDDGEGNQIGVAPGATWIAAKGCETHTCSRSALLSSGEFMLAPTDLAGNNPDPQRAPHIVNNSWGSSSGTDPYYKHIVDAWVAAGIFPQFANGNNVPGCGVAGNPGNLPGSYAAGAFDINGNIWAGSNRGPSAFGDELIKPNIAAPGVAVRSAWPVGGYHTITGTSMASPHVAGTVALMWSASPVLERAIEDTRELLDQTALDTEDLSCGGEPGNNNVWGQGKLDAFEAVEAAPRGEAGLLAGTVVNADGDPVTGATITITGEVDRSRTTGADGTYRAVLPPGTYSVTAMAFGYLPTTEPVTVVEGEAATADIVLEAKDTIAISGTVTDGSGHGWPIYARVAATGTPLDTFTDPFTGQYRLDLPVGDDYQIVVEPEYAGYAGATETVTVRDADLTLDAALPVNQCEAAPGYEPSAMVGVVGDFGGTLAEFLNEHGIPASSVTPVTIGDDVSGYDVILYNATSPPGDARFQQFLEDTDAAGAGVVFLDGESSSTGIRWLSFYTDNPADRHLAFDEEIPYLYYQKLQEHPVLAGFALDEEITFTSTSSTMHHAWFEGYEGEGRQVIANVGRGDTGVVGPGIGVQQRDHNRHVLLSMHLDGFFQGPQDWSEDGIQVMRNALAWAAGEATLDCQRVAGGLVAGHVTDANTDRPVNGASVASPDGPAGSSVATPDDPALGDGFYWTFSAAGADRQLVATADRYADDTRTVDVAAGAVTAADFVLPAGRLAVDESELAVEHRLGRESRREFTVTNTGTAPAVVEPGGLPGGFELLGGGMTVSGSVPWPAASAGAPEPGYDPHAATIEGRYGGGETASAEPADAGDVLTSWPAVEMSEAWGVGFDDTIWLSDVVSGQNLEFTVDGVPTGRSHEASWAGQWAADMARLQAGEMCQVDVGGDNGIYCWDTDSGAVTRSITGTFGWTATSQRGLAYREDTDTFYIGGWNQEVVYHIRGFSHDLPGEVLHTCSVPGLGLSGLTWNPTAGALWMVGQRDPDDLRLFDPDRCELLGLVGHPQPNENKGGLHLDHDGNLWMVGLGDPGQQLVYLVDSGVPHAPEVPWLGVSPEATTLAPGDSVTITVTMDGAATGLEQPGVHTANVRINHDTPYGVSPVGVTMVNAAPPNWGRLSGTVTVVDCEGNEEPRAGATVQIDSRSGRVLLRTDYSGGYAYWFATKESPLRLVVFTDGWPVAETRDVRIRPGREAVEDITLTRRCG